MRPPRNAGESDGAAAERAGRWIASMRPPRNAGKVVGEHVRVADRQLLQ